MMIVLAAVAMSAFAVGGAYAASDDDESREVERAIDDGGARNVILLVGDGMGDSEITVARNYFEGAGGRFKGIDALPLTGTKTTFSVQEEDPEDPDYTPESASTATAFSTGEKTSDGRISTLPGTDDPDDEEGNPPTIGELAKNAGLATGMVTTARLTDATPAASSAHVPDRGCEGPEDTTAECPEYAKENGGPGSIAEQQIENPNVRDSEGVDVLLGGGTPQYDGQTTTEGTTVAEKAESEGYEVIRNESELDDVEGRKLLGLFDKTEEPDMSDPQDVVDAGNLQPEWRGERATFREEPGVNGLPGQECDQDNPARQPEEPDLDQMTDKALELLDADEDRGFFLAVEGANIDKRAHTAQPCEQIGETVAFDRAIRKALDFAEDDGNTLVIVTGDHGHASQIVEADELNEPIGCSSVLRNPDKDDAPMRVAYATVPELSPADVGGGPGCIIQKHTGTQIRIAAQGPQAANFVGVGDDTETFDTVARALGLPGGNGGGSGDRSGGSGSNDDDDDDDGGSSAPDLGPQAAPPPIVPLGIGLLGMRRPCTRSFVVRPFLQGGLAREIAVRLDGRLVARAGLGGLLAYRVRCRSLAPGVHRLRVDGVDLTGEQVSRTVRFTRP